MKSTKKSAYIIAILTAVVLLGCDDDNEVVFQQYISPEGTWLVQMQELSTYKPVRSGTLRLIDSAGTISGVLTFSDTTSTILNPEIYVGVERPLYTPSRIVFTVKDQAGYYSCDCSFNRAWNIFEGLADMVPDPIVSSEQSYWFYAYRSE